MVEDRNLKVDEVEQQRSLGRIATGRLVGDTRYDSRLPQRSVTQRGSIS